MSEADLTELRSKLRKSMIGLLARREQSCLELLHKMQKKGFDDDLIEENISDFTERGWQSDQRYAVMIVRSRILKQHGPTKITFELKQKGVSSHIIDRALDIDFDWQSLALEAKEKKFSSQILNQKDKEKLYRFLQQRGFNSQHIRFAMNS